MKKLLKISFLLLIFVSLSLFSACESAEDKSARKKKYEESDGVLSEYIKTPIDRAKKATKKVDDRHKDLLEGL